MVFFSKRKLHLNDLETIEKEQRMVLSIQAKDNKFESETTSMRKESPSRIGCFLEKPQEEEKNGSSSNHRRNFQTTSGR